jgi:regulator of RNase E activity RraA
VVADGDGVVVVPLEVAEDVGHVANRIQSEDQETRREYYEDAGLDPDFTLE